MEWKKTGYGIFAVILALSVVVVGVGSANAMTKLKAGDNNLGQLFVLDKLFNESQNSGILSKDQTNLGDLFVLNQLFTDNTPAPVVSSGPTVAQRVSGRIVIQTEENGEAWYVYPVTNRRVSLGGPTQAYAVMANLSIGVSNADYDKIVSGDVPSNVVGRYILKVEDKGKLYYVNPVDKNIYAVSGPNSAQNLITNVGLGISNADIAKISIGNTSVAVAN